MLAAFITALAGPELAPAEAAALRSARPCGVILFARNVRDPDQVRRLTHAAREAVGDDILVLIDQEGGRVRRLKPPHWRALPPAAAYGRLYAGDPAHACSTVGLAARLTAADLRAVGINTNCAPVLDVPVPGSHNVIGNRAYGAMTAQVAALGAAVADGLMAGGVLPVMKHIPGHGRGTADSHHALPVVDTPRDILEATDFAPFRALAHLPAAMTAHVRYSAIDAEHPATTSTAVIAGVIRGSIGFDGLLMSDDISMKALPGSVRESAVATLAAGCDLVLHCNGLMAEMEAVAASSPRLEGRALARLEAALAVLQRSEPFEQHVAEAAISRVLSVSV